MVGEGGHIAAHERTDHGPVGDGSLLMEIVLEVMDRQGGGRNPAEPDTCAGGTEGGYVTKVSSAGVTGTVVEAGREARVDVSTKAAPSPAGG
ncbi:hypothetical protein PAAG_05311 [Paracoccidioides lutzii Pb01]|uniref:Uncharacterized protein n=1 Tax=Paracoccidioides lutzii (strain ATCC MYA-826 / Pb01) TaxID=502779 RepID=C1H3G8_PARBA|nr:hypothetical protein PAAG_05311 [Paracoccidioides lutzii Pb01]EEH34262.1 hypothetical protein PAAG_05311 [Paracoccidioides lutzii Pb01]